jgi:hypothetical protein
VLDHRAGGAARGLPGGRAALFLTGAVLATGCADEHDADEGQQMVIPPYGVAIPVDAGLIAQPYGVAVPVYGVAIDASTVTPKDAGASCPQVGNLPVPVYGIGIDIPRADACMDAGEDAGADAGKDAGADAGKDAGADAGKDAGPIVVPPYGIAIPAYGIAIDPKS